MASGPPFGGVDGVGEIQRYSESKVYKRKAFKAPRKAALSAVTASESPTFVTDTFIAKSAAVDAPEANPIEGNEIGDCETDRGSLEDVPAPIVASEGVNTSPELPIPPPRDDLALPLEVPRQEDVTPSQLPPASETQDADLTPELPVSQPEVAILTPPPFVTQPEPGNANSSPQPAAVSPVAYANSTPELPVSQHVDVDSSPQPAVSPVADANSTPQLPISQHADVGSSPQPAAVSPVADANSAPQHADVDTSPQPAAELPVSQHNADSSPQPAVSPIAYANSSPQLPVSQHDPNSSPQPAVSPIAYANSSPQLLVSQPDGANSSSQPAVSPVADANSTPQLPVSQTEALANDCSFNQQQAAVPAVRDTPFVNGLVEKTGLDDKVRINIASQSRQEMRELRRRLQGELNTVRTWVRRIEEKEGRISGGFNHPDIIDVDAIDNGAIHPEFVPVSVPPPPLHLPRETRPLNQLSISVLENSQYPTESFEREKRTPKANQLYRNSEFLLAKDKIPPAESNKKSKANGKKKGGDPKGVPEMGTKSFKSCSSLLDKLMKHQFGWVFNTPVDVEGLRLHDYYSIIKLPMDLGTVKARLNANIYRNPQDFAEDVRLTFQNAMTYNPKGQDVHFMAMTLLKLFEEKMPTIESEYLREMRIGFDYGMGMPASFPRKAPPFVPPPLDIRRVLDWSEPTAYSSDLRSRPISVTPSARTPAPKKPRAKDLNKREMTFDEKQKLSTNLQNLPADKLDSLVQIIKKRNSALCQQDDEIEVDIDSVDTETLWELDRFVTNYKKSLSKNKRKAELAMQARLQAQQIDQDKSMAQPAREVPEETNAGQKTVTSTSPVQVDNQGANSSRSSSSNSSSSDSGSSTSDSDSDSSSSSDSDAEHSPRT